MNNTYLKSSTLNQSEGTKKHHAASTSIEAFKAVTQSGQRMREKGKVLEAIKQHQPLTSRMISNLIGIERTNICRSLFDLLHEDKPIIKEAFTGKCHTTNKRVKYYSLIDWPQISLFHECTTND